MADTDIILEQKIRNPKEADRVNEWISPFYITADEQVHINGFLSTKDAVTEETIAASAITAEKMYGFNSQDTENDKKPVSQNTIQNGSITARAMYGNRDDETNESLIPIGTGTIQDNAVIDDKINNISIKKIDEPIVRLYFRGKRKDDSTRNDYRLRLYWNSNKHDDPISNELWSN